MAYGDLPAGAPHKPNKGLEDGACNRERCQAEPARWYNHGSYAWYCDGCARDIGQDHVNLRHWNARWFPECGHPQFETREQMDARQQRVAFELDPFADVRMGKSLFEMRPSDWLWPAQGMSARQSQNPQGLGPKDASPVGEADAPKDTRHD